MTPTGNNILEEIQTPRLNLRVPKTSDALENYLAVKESLSDLQRFPSAYPWVMEEISPSVSESFCARSQLEFAEKSRFVFHMIERPTSRLIGVISLHHPDWTARKFEVGFWCRTTAQKKGYMTEALTAITEYAFAHLNANKIEVVTSSLNIASIRVCEKSGFKLESSFEEGSDSEPKRLTHIFARHAGCQ